jgi:hypothetical protein
MAVIERLFSFCGLVSGFFPLKIKKGAFCEVVNGFIAQYSRTLCSVPLLAA